MLIPTRALAIALAGLVVPTAVSQTRLANLAGTNSEDHFSQGACFLGDLDGDACDDLIVGSPGYDGAGDDAGRVVIYSGGTGEKLQKQNGAGAGDNYGNAVAALGDVNGDGVADYAVGAFLRDSGGLTENGTIYVYSGATHKKLYTIKGSESDAFLGDSLVGVGDVNGDGFGDLLCGSEEYDVDGSIDAGRVVLYSGADGSILYTFDGPLSNGRMGQTVSAAGDVNDDGEVDMFFGSQQGDGSSRGRVWVRSGIDGALLHQIDGGLNGTKLGTSLAAVGDINKDGYDDLVAGGYQDDTAVNNGGIAYVISGLTGTNLFAPTGTNTADRFGYMVASLGDVNNDSYPDYVVGSPGWDGALGNMGYANVYSGFNGAVLFQIFGTEASLNFGESTGGAGDWDGDGRPDVAIGTIDDSEQLGANGMLIVYTLINRAQFVPGDRIEGSVAVPDTFREVTFEGLKGMKLKLTISELTGTLKPKVTLFDPKGAAVWSEKFKNSDGDQSAKETLGADGPYRLRIEGRDGTTGSFALLTDRKDSDDMTSFKEKVKGKNQNQSGQTITTLRALAGASVDMTLTGNSKWSKAPTVAVTDRHGVAVDISGVAGQSEDTVTIVGLVLADTGAYRIVVSDYPDSDKAKVTVRATITQPGLGSNTIVLP